MKKTFLLGLLGLTAAVATAFGQGTIVLDNYNTYGPYITYGDSITSANGVSGTLGIQGANVTSGSWTVGLYYAVGDITGSVASDPTHIADPTTLGALTLGVGTGSTAHINDANTPTTPGAYLATAFPVPGTPAGGGTTVTIIIVAYSGSTYNTSNYRGHSVAFTMLTTGPNATGPTQTGAPNPSGFSIFTVPEPSLFALSGVGVAALVIFRRKK